MKTLRILALIALITSSLTIFSMDQNQANPLVANEQNGQSNPNNALKSPPKVEKDEWVRLVRKTLALSAGVYIGYKFIDQKTLAESINLSIYDYNISNAMKHSNQAAYGLRVLAGVLTYLSVNKILK